MNLPKSLFRLLLGQRLPILSGTLSVGGIDQPVRIRRDAYGIPYIEAQSDVDAWYGLGFCQGQDRSFQIESFVRIVRGTLAEMAGPDALIIDRFSRRVGFYRSAERQWPMLDEETQAWVAAYARGINAGRADGCRRPAHEFTILGARPTPLTEVDVVAVIKLLAFDLSYSWTFQLLRLKVCCQDGAEAVRALSAPYPDWLPTSSQPEEPFGACVDRLSADLATFAEAVGAGGASNGWAVAPSRTATGRPICANDPHLAARLPSPWYLARLSTPEWSVAGASFVGGPAFPAGHNGHAAWGTTAGMMADTEVWLEELGPDGHSVRQGDRYVPCEVLRETIRVKGQRPVTEEVLITPRGPIISPALEGEWRALSFNAAWLAARPIRGMLHVHRARSFEAFRRCFEQWTGPSLGMVCADASGTVGWQLVGDVPRRRKGSAMLPAPGWDPEVGWEDEPVPFEQMPFVADPEVGFAVAANAQPQCEGYGPFLGADCLDGYRLTRIAETLGARTDWNVAATQVMQLDQASIPWREIRKQVLAVPCANETTRLGLELLVRWDGVMGVDSPPAAVYALFATEMLWRIARAKAPHSAEWMMGKGPGGLNPDTVVNLTRARQLSRLVREQPEGWFARGWEAEMADALETVVQALRERHGPDPDAWGWGHVRPLTLQHAMGSRAPLDRVFNLGPFPWGGDQDTISSAAIDLLDPTGNPRGIASLRMVVDVGNWKENRFVLPSGQSGNPLSPHYGDQLPLWQQGKGIRLAWSAEGVDAVAVHTLELVPA